MKLFPPYAQSHHKRTFMLSSAIALSACVNSPSTSVDLLPPKITLNGDPLLTQAYGVEYKELGASALDESDGGIEVTVYSGVDINSLGDYRIVYSATDSSANTTTVTRTVRVADLTAPVITLDGDDTLVIAYHDVYKELGATALDNVEGDIDVTVSGSVDTSSIGNYTITYTATDNAGNESALTRIVSVKDKVAPVISLNDSNVITHTYGVEYQELGATAFDDVDGDIDVTISGSVDTRVVGEHSVTYSAQDTAGNQSTLMRMVNVVDLNAPVITLNGESTIISAYGAEYEELGAIANDDLDNEVKVQVSGSVDSNALGDYIITYNAQDMAGNQSTLTRMVNVSDLSAPVITLNGNSTINSAYAAEYKELGAIAIDDLDSEVEVQTSGHVDNNALGDYTITYTAQDVAGNQSSLTRVVNVSDLSAPVITLNGDSAVIATYGVEYQELGAIAADDMDSEVEVQVSGNVNTNALGDYTVIYTAQDVAGNRSTSTRTVTVNDLTAPAISLAGGDSIITAYGFKYKELGAIAIDDLDSAVTVQISGRVNTNTLGDYTITYAAQDVAGNQSTLTRTVTVSDLTEPVVTLNGESTVKYAYGEQYIELAATATDNVDSEVEVQISASVNTNALGDYTITYSATDKAGNTGAYTRTVSVIDVTAPIITLNGSNSLQLPYAQPYLEPGATASDDVDSHIEVQVSGVVDNGVVGGYIITYTAADNSGNSSTQTRTVNVIDVTAPVITLNGNDPLIHTYGINYDDLGASALDDVDGSVNVSVEEAVNIDMINDYIVNYTATDAAGNKATATRSVAIRDLTPPAITLTGGSPIILGIGREYKEYGATAVDDLDGKISVAPPVGNVDSARLGSYPLTYTTTDAAGNKSTVTRNVEIVEPRPFISRWKTTQDNELISIQRNDSLSGFNYRVDWGDGSTLESVNESDAKHTYKQAGTYTVTISGNFPGLYGCTDYENSLLSIEQWGDIKWQSFSYAFQNCQNLMINDRQVPDLSLVKSIDHAFSGATNFNSDISLWDVSTVNDMSYMFASASAFNQDLSRWNVSAVTDMGYMFHRATSFNQDISHWDVSAVKNIWYMFSYAVAFNQDLSRWDVSAVTKMTAMFSYAAAFNQDISRWDVSAVTSMNLMFLNAAAFNQDISRWDVSAVTYMYYMFSNATFFNQDISHWNTSAVTNMCNMFRGASSFNQDISRWDVSAVKNMSGMFFNATAFNQNIGRWDVSAVKNMNAMFFNATAFNQDVSQWNVSAVTDMSAMFKGATAFNEDLGHWDVSSVNTMQQMFEGATIFNQNLSRWDVNHVTNMNQMFDSAIAFDQDLSRWDVSSVTTMYQMLEGVTLSEKNYDVLLTSWSKQDVQRDVFFSAGNSVHSEATQNAVTILQDKHWTISDGVSQ